jgi:TRAP-type mannitol/chloroaromatic compound transport system permease small subunit
MISLLVLVGGFEVVLSLHTGVERIGRYLQAAFESGQSTPPAWEHVAMGMGARWLSPGGLDPLFSAVFLLAAGYTLLHNEHVRIDVIVSRLSPRARAWVDLLGGLFFLLPMAILIMLLSWPIVVESFERNEYSSDAGGLLRWPAKILVPIGFLLLTLQGVSEIIKRIGFLLGWIPDPLEQHRDPYAEEMQKMAERPAK